MAARTRVPERRTFSCGVRRPMRFVQYRDGSGRRGLGVQLDDDGRKIVSLSDADATIPVDMVSFLRGQRSVESAEKCVSSCRLKTRRYYKLAKAKKKKKLLIF